MKEKVGFIGLGAMGLPMAENLLLHGYELYVTVNRNPKPVEQLKRKGAAELRSVEEIAAKCDILITILPADSEMEDVLLSESILSALSPDKILIEMTSGSPDTMKKIGDVYSSKGIRVLDAPVSGGTIGAQQGTLTVMAGGEEDVLEQVRPVLKAMAQKIYRVGGIGAGKAIKALNQMLAGIHMIAAAEAAALADKLNIDNTVLKEVIGASSGASWMLENKLDTIISQAYEPGFKLSLMRKDVEIAVSEARGLKLPLAETALKLYKQSELNDGDKDFSAIAISLQQKHDS